MTPDLICGDCLEVLPTLPAEHFDLVIADPPYFETKGDFDFQWPDFAAYLQDVDRWAREITRVLKKTGSLFWYGHAKKIAYSQVVLDQYLNLENVLVWEKTECRTRIGSEEFRSFMPVTERILFYSREVNRTGLQEIKLDKENFKELRGYFRGLQEWIGLSIKGINQRLGHRRAEHAFYWGSTQWDLPMEEVYLQLVEHFGICAWPGYRQWADLKQEHDRFMGQYTGLIEGYESKRRPFNNALKLTDVLKYSQEAHETSREDHPTQKPPTLTRAIVTTTAKKDGRALVPFMGSGVEVVECHLAGMQTTGIEIDPDFYRAACSRIAKDTAQLALF